MQYTPSEPFPSHPKFDRFAERFNDQSTFPQTSKTSTSLKELHSLIARIR
jgi:hypothetical protein